MMSFNFKENLRNELDYQGIMVKELSARTGIPIATLDCYLGARATTPSVEAAIKIAQALKVSVEYLVIGDKTTTDRVLGRNCRETLEIIRFVECLKPEQRKALLRLLIAFTETERPIT